MLEIARRRYCPHGHRSAARPWALPPLSAPLSLHLPPLPPGVPFSRHYSVVLLIDQREQYSRTGPGGRPVGRAGACVSVEALLGNEASCSWLCMCVLKVPRP
jgi:hypothetical protein